MKLGFQILLVGIEYDVLFEYNVLLLQLNHLVISVKVKLKISLFIEIFLIDL